ncbi:phage tail protein [Bradyrhizobium prioriisuperbiae]|uniref:phage tail protein n=1 Tax=Bradyrhizobium prioriisuperbiae TaxID=2854389 RepID=UPI0028E62865|nr:tail fiber protein [Bradyrhizobium prioritasuperba]
MTFWKWSRTASANATADSTCPFPEGMAPSAVNDGVRGLMAAAAKYRDDMSGALISSGTSSAYTLTTNQGFTGPIADGTGLAFWAHATNAAGATLNVDSTGAVPFMAPITVALPAGVLVAGTPYRIRYTTIPGWVIESMFGQVYSIPIGGFLPYLSTTPPNSSFVLPFGQAISRTTYAALFSMIGGTFGAGDGSSTFNIPDLRGRAIFGLDNMGGVAANRVTGASGIGGASIGAMGGAETVVLSTAQMPPHAHGGITGSMNRSNPHSHSQIDQGGASNISGGGSYAIGNQRSFQTGLTDVNHEHGIALEGGGQAHNNMPPAIILPMLLRVI